MISRLMNQKIWKYSFHKSWKQPSTKAGLSDIIVYLEEEWKYVAWVPGSI